MKPLRQWQNFLESNGAEFTSVAGEDHLSGFAAQDRPLDGSPDCQMTALTHAGLLRVIGPDSEKFLQGQLTCDVAKLTTATSTPGAACTPQGRVYSSFRLVKAAESPELTYLLRLAADNLERSRDSLGKYAVFYKARLEDTRDQYVGIGIWGKDAGACLTDVFQEIPQAVHQVIGTNNGWLVRVPGNTPRFECWLPEADAETLWSTLATKTHCRAPHAWKLEDIRSGLAEISAATAEAFIPHMLNYQNLDAISFDKGCYTGQEIVARTEYRGKAKRGLFRLEIDSTAVIEPGSEFMSATHPGAINVVSSSPADANGVQEALVVMATGLDAGAALELKSGELGCSARILPLQY